MTSSDKLKEIADSLGQKTKKSNVLGTGLTFNMNNFKGFRIKFYSTLQTFKVDIKTNSSIAVSFHQPDSICLINQPLPLEYPTRVFTGLTDSRQEVIEFLIKVKNIINGLDLKNSESLVIYQNQISAELDPNRDFNKAFEKLFELIPFLNNGDKERIKEVNDLPSSLSELYSLFDKYSISDDQERDELIESLTKNEINILIDQVDKKTNDINKFLDSFIDTPLTENALRLISLTELVMELKNAPQHKL